MATMNLDHIKKYEKELKECRSLDTGDVSPHASAEICRATNVKQYVIIMKNMICMISAKKRVP